MAEDRHAPERHEFLEKKSKLLNKEVSKILLMNLFHLYV